MRVVFSLVLLNVVANFVPVIADHEHVRSINGNLCISTRNMLAIFTGRCLTYNSHSAQFGCQYNCSLLLHLLNHSLAFNDTSAENDDHSYTYDAFVAEIVNAAGCAITLPNQSLLWSGSGPGSPIGDMAHALSYLQVGFVP